MRKETSYGIIPLRKEGSDTFVLLIQHRSGNHWSFPKGNPDPGEKPLESATRELKEETGLVVEKLLEHDPITEHYTLERKGEPTEKTVTYFPAMVSGALIVQTEEVIEAKWVLLKEAPDHLTYEEAKRVSRRVQL